MRPVPPLSANGTFYLAEVDEGGQASQTEEEGEDEQDNAQSSSSEYQPSESESDLSAVETGGRAASRINGGRRTETGARQPPRRPAHTHARSDPEPVHTSRGSRAGSETNKKLDRALDPDAQF